MTKQDYELIAETIRESCPMGARGRLAVAFCRKLAKDNAQFDPVKFVMASTTLTDIEVGRFLTLHGIPINVNV